MLHREVLSTPVVILSLVDNSLLVYTADNTLYHYLIVPTKDTIKLHLCGSINFNGVIVAPSAVRVLSWMIPAAQKRTSQCPCMCPLRPRANSASRDGGPGERPLSGDCPDDRRRQARTAAAQEGLSRTCAVHVCSALTV